MSDYQKNLWITWLKAASVRAVKTMALTSLAGIPEAESPVMGDEQWS